MFDLLARRRLLVLLVLAALPRLGLAWFEHGVNHPDEIFQMLEPAHRWVYGYGIQSWEFQDGARSWLLPGLIALLWKGLALLGLSDPLTVVPLLRLPFVALAVYGVYLASRLASRFAGERAGDLAALLAAFTPLALLLDFRTTAEAASAPVVLLALLWMVDGKLARAGACLALLVFLRPTNAIVGLGAVGWFLFVGRFRDTARLALGMFPVTVAGGLFDWITWGGPFHHLVEYLRFNWAEGGAELFGVQGAWMYLSILLVTAPLLVLLVLPATVILIRRGHDAHGPLVVAGFYLLVHSAIGHKEPRFLLPVLPLLVALTAAGVVSLFGPWIGRHVTAPRTRRSMAVVGAAAVALMGMATARGLTYQDVQEPRGEAQDRVLFGRRDSLNRMLAEAGRRSDLCGMLILGLVPNELFSGGTTYLNRDVLLTSPTSRQMWLLFSQAANYAVSATAVLAPGWHRVAQQNGVALVTRPGGCVSLPEEYRPKAKRPQTGPSSGSPAGGH